MEKRTDLFVCEERRAPYGDFPEVLTLKSGQALHDAVDELFGVLLTRHPVDTTIEAVLDDRLVVADQLEFLPRTTRRELALYIESMRTYTRTSLLDFLDVDLLTAFVVDYSIYLPLSDLC